MDAQRVFDTFTWFSDANTEVGATFTWLPDASFRSRSRKRKPMEVLVVSDEYIRCEGCIGHAVLSNLPICKQLPACEGMAFIPNTPKSVAKVVAAILTQQKGNQ